MPTDNSKAHINKIHFKAIDMCFDTDDPKKKAICMITQIQKVRSIQLEHQTADIFYTNTQIIKNYHLVTQAAIVVCNVSF